MIHVICFLLCLWPASAKISSLFRSSELISNDTNWIIEQVQVIPLDDGHTNQKKLYQSYMIYRQNSSENSSSFILDLYLNQNFNSHIPIEYDQQEIHSNISQCLFYTGSVRHWGEIYSLVAISVCNGLTGLIHHTQIGTDYFLEPLLNTSDQSYILTYQTKFPSKQSQLWSCEVQHPEELPKPIKPNRTRRSVIRERFIETLLVADATVTEFFSHQHITELYLLTMMNIVHSIYKHVTLGYPVEIVLTRIIMLNNQSDYQMASKSHETLNRFCEWQEQLKKNRSITHDVGVFLTRKSLCQPNTSCSTIGLAHMSGMCMINRSCNINQDIGLFSAFTIAHEIGHNLGMSHDGDKGQCTVNSRGTNSDTIMIPSYSKIPINMWSQCSRDSLMEFFDQGWGTCLNNKPRTSQPFDDILPGIIFDLDEQCRLSMGPHSTYCFLGDEPPINVCDKMMCTKIHENRSICLPSMNSQPTDGTLCGPNKWCLHGRCTPMSYRTETPPIHGGWSPWTPWSSCSHTCGLGVEYQQRTCTNPKPDFGGKHCLGVRKRYRTCSLQPCKKPSSHSKSESHLNCDELNLKSNGTKWKTVPWFTSIPCMVFCTPIISPLSLTNQTTSSSNVTLAGDEVGKVESIKFRDGAQCTIDDEDEDDLIQSDGMCIAGQCQKLGCDKQLYSTAVEDECGICNGNRSECQQITKLIQYKKDDRTTAGSYVKIASINRGIATFQLEKSTHSQSFLALKIKEKYSLNGNRSIIERKTLLIGQTRIWYQRGSKQEILEGRGQPLTDDLDVMLLVLNNDLIKIKYTYWDLINQTKSNQMKSRNQFYHWIFENNTNDECSCTTRQPYCMFKSHQNEFIVVSDNLCDVKSKPKPIKCQHTHCSIQVPSAPRWQIGSWRACEGRCWPEEAFQRRSLLCVRTISNNKTHTIPTSICIHWLATIPITIRECPQNLVESLPKCLQLKGYHRWNTSEWIGNCSKKDPCAMQYRNITCLSDDLNSICTANEKYKPIDRRPCNTLCGQWLVSYWSENCTGPCENATIARKVWCNSSICNQNERPLSIRRCIPSHCVNQSIYKKLETTTTTTTAKSSTTKTTSQQISTTKILPTNPKKISTITHLQKKVTTTTTTTKKNLVTTKPRKIPTIVKKTSTRL